LLDACAVLDEAALDAGAPGAYGSVRDTLVHLCAAEERYVAALTGRAPEYPLREADAFPGFDTLRERAQASGTALIAIAEDVRDGQPVRGTYRGEPFEMSAAVFLLQAVNHATEHRTNVTTILAAGRTEPPVLDGWAFAERED